MAKNKPASKPEPTTPAAPAVPSKTKVVKALPALPALDGDAAKEFEALAASAKGFIETFEKSMLVPPRYLSRTRRLMQRRLVEIIMSRKGDKIANKRARLEEQIAKMKAKLAELGVDAGEA